MIPIRIGLCESPLDPGADAAVVKAGEVAEAEAGAEADVEGGVAIESGVAVVAVVAVVAAGAGAMRTGCRVAIIITGEDEYIRVWCCGATG